MEVRSSNPDPVDSPIDIRKPNYEKQFANLHYQSESTNEIGCIEVRPGMTEEMIMDQYWRKFPKEAQLFLNEVKWANDTLKSKSGMSDLRSIMSLGKVPEIVMCAMKFIREDYWEDKKRSIAFFRKFPKFMVGDHSVKAATGIIIK